MVNNLTVIGACLDMCPKSERKFRIKNRLVSSFELSDNNQLDEKRMIKEYRRSAAGQDEERPDELRTEETLVRTMDYIISEIVDKLESTKKIQAWYDFIWNRTRAIRKDITVQRLTGPAIIKILERIARFHILCSYKFCEEQTNVFDFKINEENLVNCIQMLLELYEKLNLLKSPNSGQQFTNREEFLCYHILQNLDRENLVREISSIDKVTLKTHHLQFAIRTFVAYKTLNYFAFMKSMLNSSLLQACILNRYLNRVRSTAFCLIKRALSSPKECTQVSQDYFMRTLLLKENELKRFCDSIKCDLVDQKVIFSRSNKLNLDISSRIERSALIDRKFEKLKLSSIIDGSVQKEISSADELY